MASGNIRFRVTDNIITVKQIRRQSNAGLKLGHGDVIGDDVGAGRCPNAGCTSGKHYFHVFPVADTPGSLDANTFLGAGGKELHIGNSSPVRGKTSGGLDEIDLGLCKVFNPPAFLDLVKVAALDDALQDNLFVTDGGPGVGVSPQVLQLADEFAIVTGFKEGDINDEVNFLSATVDKVFQSLHFGVPHIETEREGDNGSHLCVCFHAMHGSKGYVAGRNEDGFEPAFGVFNDPLLVRRFRQIGTEQSLIDQSSSIIAC